VYGWDLGEERRGEEGRGGRGGYIMEMWGL